MTKVNIIPSLLINSKTQGRKWKIISYLSFLIKKLFSYEFYKYKFLIFGPILSTSIQQINLRRKFGILVNHGHEKKYEFLKTKKKLYK